MFRWMRIAVVTLLSSGFAVSQLAAQEITGEIRNLGEGDMEVLARGPVHEAFAEPVVFDPAPGQVIMKKPPEAIEELPPDDKPEGENVAWIPGYWAWEDDREDFIWISGFWRVMPPGRQWVPGYWTETSSGFQYVSGFWASTEVEEVQYLPQPPATLEVGPSTPAPSANYVWTPGYWHWNEVRYAWRPGFWMQPNPNWIWVPSYYSWSPRGYVFINGYWDYLLPRRGMLYAPIYFRPSIYTHVSFYRYRPTYLIDIGLLTNHFFVRPNHCHYYFGDYYARSYYQRGVYPWFAFHSGRYGYDPIWVHHRHRHGQDWDRRAHAYYEHHRDYADHRPSRTFNVHSDRNRRDEDLLVKPLDRMITQIDRNLKLEKLDSVKREQMTSWARRTREFSRERHEIESRVADSRRDNDDRSRSGDRSKSDDRSRDGKSRTDDRSNTDRVSTHLRLPKSPFVNPGYQDGRVRTLRPTDDSRTGDGRRDGGVGDSSRDPRDSSRDSRDEIGSEKSDSTKGTRTRPGGRDDRPDDMKKKDSSDRTGGNPFENRRPDGTRTPGSDRSDKDQSDKDNSDKSKSDKSGNEPGRRGSDSEPKGSSEPKSTPTIEVPPPAVTPPANPAPSLDKAGSDKSDDRARVPGSRNRGPDSETKEQPSLELEPPRVNDRNPRTRDIPQLNLDPDSSKTGEIPQLNLDRDGSRSREIPQINPDRELPKADVPSIPRSTPIPGGDESRGRRNSDRDVPKADIPSTPRSTPIPGGNDESGGRRDSNRDVPKVDIPSTPRSTPIPGGNDELRGRRNPGRDSAPDVPNIPSSSLPVPTPSANEPRLSPPKASDDRTFPRNRGETPSLTPRSDGRPPNSGERPSFTPRGSDVRRSEPRSSVRENIESVVPRVDPRTLPGASSNPPSSRAPEVPANRDSFSRSRNQGNASSSRSQIEPRVPRSIETPPARQPEVSRPINPSRQPEVSRPVTPPSIDRSRGNSPRVERSSPRPSGNSGAPSGSSRPPSGSDDENRKGRRNR